MHVSVGFSSRLHLFAPLWELFNNTAAAHKEIRHTNTHWLLARCVWTSSTPKAAAMQPGVRLDATTNANRRPKPHRVIPRQGRAQRWNDEIQSGWIHLGKLTSSEHIPRFHRLNTRNLERWEAAAASWASNTLKYKQFIVFLASKWTLIGKDSGMEPEHIIGGESNPVWLQ